MNTGGNDTVRVCTICPVLSSLLNCSFTGYKGWNPSKPFSNSQKPSYQGIQRGEFICAPQKSITNPREAQKSSRKTFLGKKTFTLKLS